MTLNLALRKIVSTDDVLYIAFNQDHGCFSVGTELGFRIYNCDPFRETFRRNFPNGGIGIVEMLFRCNILALVGGGKTPCFPTNRVKLWDDHTMQVIGDLSFKDPVHAVRLRRDKVVVATGTMVYVYSFDKLELQQRYNTFDNPLGVFALSPSTSRCVLVCPALQAGVARIEDLTDDKGGFLNAHESPLSMLAISSDGTLVATASEKGTLIRVFDAVTNQRKKEFRRGSEAVVIYSLSFSVDAKFIACSSSHGTIHVFSLDDAQGEAPAANRKSMLSALSSVSPYFASEWSYAWYKGLECPAVCAFGQHSDTLLVVCADGKFLLLQQQSGGGELTKAREFTFPQKQS
eukprot:TRINITY_DN15646_c0_g1_i2.p2 TRINITY_DN15646_c0_g1~~TRINITY_DN15646_c0_g1_i2.p2  ORF type:complete len:347 (+),score=121.24 TRINITY_DN15646_c0_g1_i2:113-1153(+)